MPATAAAMSADTLAYYQREADRQERGMKQYGGNPELVKLRCFKYYHPDQGSFITTPEGRERWLGPKASRVYAILDRSSSSTSRLTMKDIASEAMASTSTVSRTVQKLQAYGLFAIDVIRGRHGGIYVRRRRPGDHLKHYAAAAWKRIRQAAERAISRTERNVASTSSLEEGEGSWTPVPTTTYMDATFTPLTSDELSSMVAELETEHEMAILGRKAPGTGAVAPPS